MRPIPRDWPDVSPFLGLQEVGAGGVLGLLYHPELTFDGAVGVLLRPSLGLSPATAFSQKSEVTTPWSSGHPALPSCEISALAVA